MILIYSRADDEQVNSVVNSLAVDSLFRINSETPENYKVSVKLGGLPVAPVYELTNGTKRIDLRDIRVVWWRGPQPSSPDNPFSTLLDALLGLNVFWVNSPSRQEDSVRIAFQQEAARDLALSLPPTLITTDIDSANSFMSEYGKSGIVHKHFSTTGGRWIDEPVTIDSLEKRITGDARAPVALQKMPSSPEDIFVHLIDDSPVTGKEVEDLLDRTAFPNIGKALPKLLKRLGLSYGTCRLRADSDGGIYFLDFTPFGDWSSITAEIRAALANKLSAFISTKDRSASQGRLGEIALSLSGGGYRAAAFHLGTLKMLNELRLLKDVTRLSTVSGGTILGAKYLVDTASGVSFQTFADNFEEKMAKTNITRLALRRLQSTIRINGEKRTPSIIRAAASIYAEPDFIGPETLGGLGKKGGPIRDISFNSTEFRTGANFRFQIGASGRVTNGTSIARINKKVSEEISLAGIVAASSCFPGGFEPICFPSDFTWKRPILTIKQDLGESFEKDIDLMDGGIFDNQGIDSVKTFLGRKNSSTDLFIISDTSPRNPSIFQRDSLKNKGIVPVWVLLGALAIIFAAAVTASIMIGRRIYEIVQRPVEGNEILLYAAPFLVVFTVALLFLIGFLLFVYFFSKINFWVGARGWSHLFRLRLRQAYILLKSRVASVLSLTTSIFMQKIRSSAFESVFTDAKLTRKLMPNLIYDVDDESRWKNQIPEILFPVQSVRDKVKNAEKYPTCLDFEDREGKIGRKELTDLIECGRITTCFNILRYLYQHRYADARIPGTPLNDLFLEVKDKWIKLNK